MKRIIVIAIVLLSAAFAGWLLLTRPDGKAVVNGDALESDVVHETEATRPPRPVKGPSDEEAAVKDDEDEAEADDESQDEVDEEEALVNDFDAMTDAFMEPVAEGKRIEMEDIAKFCEKFAKVPKSRKEECLHRALNLIPDENVMLLAGILMDKTQDPELVELVFNDVLNRDEAVKQPLLEQVFKDREHPNWADAAWILDVTGSLPPPKDGD